MQGCDKIVGGYFHDTSPPRIFERLADLTREHLDPRQGNVFKRFVCVGIVNRCRRSQSLSHGETMWFCSIKSDYETKSPSGQKRHDWVSARTLMQCRGSFFTKAGARSGHRLFENFCALGE